ncbi:hypothetical protein RIF29_25345 [Crotalaria pallida]|uniref:Uncharacterized protein n=1 Tax=Crotalaria pallida TaxID=3830 RepID=A0AAN9HZ76_CROPI
MPSRLREENGGTLPDIGPEDVLPPNQSGWRQRIRPTEHTISNNIQDFSVEMDIEAGYGLLLKVVDGHGTSSPLK